MRTVSCPLAFLLLATVAAGAAGAEVPASFDHGVASGDPLPGRVVIWTRVTPRVSGAGRVPVRWTVSRLSSDHSAEARAANAMRGWVEATAERDFTVKVDVLGLTPGKTYFFSFKAGTTLSPVGRFKVPLAADKHVTELQYAVFSCSNWGFGYFNAYDAAARLDLDFWLHLGDSIYEYDEDHYPSKREAVRTGLQPPHECLTLSDYRQRHALYRQDLGLQALSANSAMIAIWDDHEIANNPWVDGAQNHNDGEGNWSTRKADAIRFVSSDQSETASTKYSCRARAYHEWMPTRTRDVVMATAESDADTDTDTDVELVHGERIYRRFTFGNLAALQMLENRLVNRSNGEADPLKHTKSAGEPPQSPSEVAQAGIASIIAGKPPQNWAEDAALRGEMAELKRLLEDYRSDPGKTVLGARQMAWLADGVQAAVARGTRWQLVGQQTVLFDTFLDFDLALELQRAELSKLQAASGVDPRGKTAQEVSRLEAMLGAWEAVLHNVTGWGCGAVFCFGPQRTARIFDEDDPSYGQQVTVTPSVMARMRNLYASSKYEIPVGFDSWEGYTAERLDLLSALTPAAGAAVVYGGDSHNAWAGLVRSEPVGGGAARRGRRAAVCAEIDVTSTTSTGTQHFIPLLPAGLVEAALLAANRDRSFGHSECDESASGCNFRSSMRYTRMTGLRGFTLVKLTHNKHHAEYVYVDTIADRHYTISRCEALDYFADAKNTEDGGYTMSHAPCVIAPRAALPYESMGALPWWLCGCGDAEGSPNCGHGCRSPAQMAGRPCKDQPASPLGQELPAQPGPDFAALILAVILGFVGGVYFPFRGWGRQSESDGGRP